MTTLPATCKSLSYARVQAARCRNDANAHCRRADLYLRREAHLAAGQSMQRAYAALDAMVAWTDTVQRLSNGRPDTGVDRNSDENPALAQFIKEKAHA